MQRPTLLWFRQDLRLADNPALLAAIARDAPIIPVFIHAPDEEADWTPGAAARWWQHRSLEALAESLQRCGTRLVLRHGPTLPCLRELITETNAAAVLWNRRYEPAVIARDRDLKRQLRAAGLEADSYNAALLAEPWEVQNQSGRPYQVFTPFWRHLLKQLQPAAPLPAPTALAPPPRWPRSDNLAQLGMLPRIRWYETMQGSWTPGERGAQQQLEQFVDEAFFSYLDARERPAVAGTSRLSPHLHHGEISPRQIWHGVAAAATRRRIDPAEWRSSQFLTELGWREFAHHLLYHFPHTPLEPLRAEFKSFPWRRDASALAAWQSGRTGVPLVDAGMRQLWATGWMHNRVRMVVASFLVKNLLLPWQDGARWFWDTLVDADLAANTLGWQWSTGCGADAAPYFRIFNPVSQGARFDPQGVYVRRWVPELARLPDAHIHAPWEAAPAVLAAASIALGETYPAPIVDLKASRTAALTAYRAMRG